MKLTLDIENTVTKRDGKMHLDPFEPENSLTMIGVLTDQDVERHNISTSRCNGFQMKLPYLSATMLRMI